MNISILASIGCQNLGDELILKNEVQLLRERYGENTKFRVFSYDVLNPFLKDGNIEYREYFPVGSKNPKNTLRNIKNFSSFIGTIFWSNLVVVGGGGIFYEKEIQLTRSPLDLWVFRMKWIRFFRKKVLFFAVGIDVSSEIGLKKIQKIFLGKKMEVTVRDRESSCVLQEVGIKSEIVQDPVFHDNPTSLKKGKILGAFASGDFNLKDIEKYSFIGKKVGIALRKGYIGKSKNEKLEFLMIEELLKMIERKGGNIVLLPHSFHSSDIKANDYFFLKQFETSTRVLENTLADVYDVYTNKEIDLCIAMRLHSIILSHVYGVDTIALSYSQKTDETIKKLLR